MSPFSEGGPAFPSLGLSVTLVLILPDQGRHGWLWIGELGIWVRLGLGWRFIQFSLLKVTKAEAGPPSTKAQWKPPPALGRPWEGSRQAVVERVAVTVE